MGCLCVAARRQAVRAVVVSFLSAQHTDVIPWNGGLSLHFITKQPHKRAAIETAAFPALYIERKINIKERGGCGGVPRAKKEF